uniref:ATP synthase subunit b, chloroplastic n=1 Tax=Euglena viridis TaxID=3040 RepID=M1EWE5_EUGVI|nr:ATPase subunit I [Euglena viridis]AEY70819.3 ATPase subunit I [Euglena viridis]
MLAFISEAEGFGINTDIFETNVLNLSVVIGVLIYYGRITLSDIIKSRKDSILKNLQEAETKFREAEENLAFAKKNFEMAKTKAEQIRTQGTTLSSQTTKLLLDSVEEDIKRLKLANLSAIRLEEEKSISELCKRLSEFALSRAIDKLNKKLNPSFQKKIIAQSIEKLSLKVLIRK